MPFCRRTHLDVTALIKIFGVFQIFVWRKGRHRTSDTLATATTAAEEKRVVVSLHFALKLRARRYKEFDHFVLSGMARRVQ